MAVIYVMRIPAMGEELIKFERFIFAFFNFATYLCRRFVIFIATFANVSISVNENLEAGTAEPRCQSGRKCVEINEAETQMKENQRYLASVSKF